MGKSVVRSALKHIVERTARLAGFEIVAKWRAPSLPMAKRLSALFAHCGITSVVDIGANQGQYRDFLRDEVGFAGLICSFEPDPELATALMERAARHDPRWKVFPYALGAAQSRPLFHRMENSVFNSFREPSPGQPDRFREMNNVVGTFPVEMCTLDQMTREFGDLAHTYIKIDTQGFDLEVLQGGRNAIRSIPALQTEVSCRPVYDGSPSFLQSIAAFEAEGFAISDCSLSRPTRPCVPSSSTVLWSGLSGQRQADKPLRCRVARTVVLLRQPHQVPFVSRPGLAPAYAVREALSGLPVPVPDGRNTATVLGRPAG